MSIIDLKMNVQAGEDGDLFFDGDLAFVEGPESLAQRVRNALLMHRGQWFLDTRQGAPWADVLGDDGGQAAVDALIRAEASRVPGVLRIASLVSTVDGDVYTADFVVVSAGGEAPASITFGVDL